MSSAAPAPEPRDRKPGWQTLLREASEPLFLLNRRRRLLYVNPAWEKLTGLTLAEVRGQMCRRRASRVEPLEQLLALFAPPPEALAGRPCSTRRRGPGKDGVVWWDLAFFPWSDGAGPLAILGKIEALSTTAAVHAALPEKLMQLRQHANGEHRLESLESESPLVQRLAEQVRLAATTTLPVWIQGPPGSGKEWLARTIHQLSPRRESYFARVAAGLLPADLLAALLHEAPKRWRLGALLIKQPERLPREVQTLVLEMLDGDGEQPRLIAATSATPAVEIEEGRLLPELYCRLSALTLHVPALADRLGDLPRLIDRLLPRAAQAAGNPGAALGPDAVDCLRRHAWPGNLMELYETLVAACGRGAGARLGAADLPFYLQQTPLPLEAPIPLDLVLEKVERRLITLALKLARDNKTRAAELLAIWRPRLMRRIEQLGLGDPETSRQ